MKKADVVEFYRRLAEANPHPETELESVNVYTLLVAVVLSAQATDAGVNKATRALFAEVDTPEKMVALGVDALKRHIRTIGLFNTKAKNVIALSEALIAQHDSEVPNDRAALETLPGVGRKTANVVLGHALGVPGLPVDRHVLRVSNRIGLVKNDDPVKVEAQLSEMLPPARWTRASDCLILHGRRVCKPKPMCKSCHVRPDCDFYRTGVTTKPAGRSARKSPSGKTTSSPKATRRG